MVIDRDGQNSLRPILTDHVLIELFANTHRSRQTSQRNRGWGCFGRTLLGNNLGAERHTFVTNKNAARASDKPLNFLLTACTE